MLTSFLNRFGWMTREQSAMAAQKAIQEKYPDWYLEYAGAHQFDVPSPTFYERQADLMTKVSYLYTVITLTAQSAASQDFDIEVDDKEIKDHPLEMLLKSPNPMQTGFEFLRDHFTFKLLNGASYWWLNTTSKNAPPSEVWLIPPGNIEPVPDDKLGIKEYLYHPGDGSTVSLPTWQVLWFRGFHPSNQYASLSGLVPLAQAMKTDIETQKFLSTVYGKNSGRLPGIIAFKSPVNDVDWRKIKNDIKQSADDRNYLMLRGVGDGVSWLQAAATLNEMETLNGRKMTQEDIYNTFAPGLMNMTSVNATEANAVTGKKTYAEFTLFPMLTDTQQKINKELSPRYGKIKLEFDDPRGDDKQLKMAETDQYSKFHTVNEVRVDKFKSLPLEDKRGLLFVSQVAPVQTPAPAEGEVTLPEPGVLTETVSQNEQMAAVPVETATNEDENAVAKALIKWRGYAEKHGLIKALRFEHHDIPAALYMRISADLADAASTEELPAIFAKAAKEIPLIVLARSINRMAENG